MNNSTQLENVISLVKQALVIPKHADHDSQMALKHLLNELYRVQLEPGAIFDHHIVFLMSDSPLDSKDQYIQPVLRWLDRHWPAGEYERQSDLEKSRMKPELDAQQLIRLAEETKNSTLFQKEPFVHSVGLLDQLIAEIRKMESDSNAKMNVQLELAASAAIPVVLPFMRELSRWQVNRRERAAAKV